MNNFELHQQIVFALMTSGLLNRDEATEEDRQWFHSSVSSWKPFFLEHRDELHPTTRRLGDEVLQELST